MGTSKRGVSSIPMKWRATTPRESGQDGPRKQRRLLDHWIYMTWIAVVVAIGPACEPMATHVGEDVERDAPAGSISDTVVDTSAASPVTVTTPRSDNGKQDGDEVKIDVSRYPSFAESDFFEIDWARAVLALSDCMADNGYPVEVVDSGDGLSFKAIPADQQRGALAVMRACREALRIPTYRPLTETEILQVYAYLGETEECLRNAGYPTSPRPSIDTFLDTWSTGPWSPFSEIPRTQLADAESECPPAPLGGFGTWAAGTGK